MAQLMLHKEILKNFRDLPHRVQKGVSELIERFQMDPNDPVIHLHSVKESMIDSKVRGVNLPDGFRAIVIAPERGDTYLLMHIAKHDDAYNWARSKKFEVHPSTGVFQVLDVAEIKEHPVGIAKVTNDYVLALLSEEDLFQAGVPRQLIPSVKALDSDASFEALAPYLPEDCREVLFGLASGMSLDEALESTLGSTPAELEEIAPASSGDFSHLAAAPNFAFVAVDDEKDLREILEKSLAEWRVFLHPSQRKIVNWNLRGPMSVNGAAGTGKTVALIHRAVRLARELPASSARVLVTTFTTNLAPTIEAQISQLDKEAASRIEVTNLHALARTICARAGWKGRIAEDEDLNQIWGSIFDGGRLGQLPMTPEQIRDEYASIVDPSGIETEDGYLSAVRSGLPRLTRDGRKRLWPIFAEFQREQKRRNLLTFDGAVHQARLAVEREGPHYPHVLVDEVQDFGLEALRLIKALGPKEDNVINPIALFGDGHQRIYGSRIPLSRAGLEVRGRSRRLKLNYRTSEEIRRWAQGVLKGVEVDDLNGGVATTVGDRSAFKLMEPELHRIVSEKDEADVIVKWVKELLEGGKFASHEICISPAKTAIEQAIKAAGLSLRKLRRRETDPGDSEPGIRLATMHRIKGLEFRAVAMACGGADEPLLKGKDADPRDRALRYVAATRARERLLVTLSRRD